MANSSTLTGSFTGIGTSAEVKFGRREFNISVYGSFQATIVIERSFDNGTSWQVAKTLTEAFEGVGKEVETEVTYRFRCTNFTAGEAFYRLGLTRF